MLIMLHLLHHCCVKRSYLVFREVLVVLDEVCQDPLSRPLVLSFLQSANQGTKCPHPPGSHVTVSRQLVLFKYLPLSPVFPIWPGAPIMPGIPRDPGRPCGPCGPAAPGCPGGPGGPMTPAPPRTALWALTATAASLSVRAKRVSVFYQD